MVIVVDIDGTLADWSRRSQKAGLMPSRSEHHLFQQWLDAVQSPKSLAQDKPIVPVVKLVKSLLAEGHIIVYLTGRSDNYRAVTEDWLDRKALLTIVYMRDKNDLRSAASYKEEQLKKIKRIYGRISLAIDDDYDGDMEAVYKKLDIVHLKVQGVL